MKNILLILTCILGVHSLQGQIHFAPRLDSKDAASILNRTLLVKIYEVDEKAIAAWTNEEKQEYRKWVEDNNELVKTSFEKYWGLHKTPQFKSALAIDKAVEAEPDKYAVFTYLPFVEGSFTTDPGANVSPYAYKLMLPNKGKLVTSTISLSTGNKAETEMEFKFILLNMGKYLNACAGGKSHRDTSLYNAKKNYQILTAKTLLFDEEMLNVQRLSKEDAKKMYPHKMSYSNAEDIYKAVEKADSSILYMTYVFNASYNVWMYAIVDPSTMNVIAMQAPNRVHFGLGKQYESNMSAQSKAAKFGGSPYSYKQPYIIWKSRPRIELDERDFQYLGSKITVDRNYSNPLNR
ncbi:MAG: hypothetical protein ACJ75J_05880 [Cytophagaceae bacterium]